MHHLLRSTGLDRVAQPPYNPVLRRNIGQQLMCRHSERGRCWLPPDDADVDASYPPSIISRYLIPAGDTVTLRLPAAHTGDARRAIFQYVHSYVVPVSSPETAAITDCVVRGAPLCIATNFYAVQFHPEKAEPPAYLLSHFLNFVIAYD